MSMWPFKRSKHPETPKVAPDGLPFGPRDRFKLVQIEHPYSGGWRAYYWHEYVQGGKWEDVYGCVERGLTRAQVETLVETERAYIRGRDVPEKIVQEIEV
jgi:hypothetical protein